MSNEADTCRKYVLPKLVDAGWDNQPHRINEQVTFTDGRIVLAGNTALFQDIRQRIIELDESIIEKTTKLYVCYRVTKNFAEIYIQKSQLRIILRPVEYADPKGLVQQIPAGYNWTLDRAVYLKPGDDLDYVFGLIESYKDVL